MTDTLGTAAENLELLKQFNVGSGNRPWIWTWHQTCRNLSVLCRRPRSHASAWFEQLHHSLERKKTLDHVYTNQLYLCSKVEVVELKLSDHRPLKFTLVQKWMEEQTRHVLSPLGCWQCPQRFTDYEWTEHLKKVWTQHPEVPLLNHLPKDVDVDIEWNSITASSMTCLTVARRSLVPLKTDQLVSRVTMSKSSRLLREFALILVT